MERQEQYTTKKKKQILWCVRQQYTGEMGEMGPPWWSSDEESTCQYKRQGFIPQSRKIPHAKEQLRVCTTTSETACCNYWRPSTQGLCSATREASAIRSRRTTMKSKPPLTATGESTCASTKTQHNHQQTNKEGNGEKLQGRGDCCCSKWSTYSCGIFIVCLQLQNTSSLRARTLSYIPLLGIWPIFSTQEILNG